MEDTYHLQAMKALLSVNNKDFIESNYLRVIDKIGEKVIDLLVTNGYNLVVTPKQTGCMTFKKEETVRPAIICNKEHSITIDRNRESDYNADIVYKEIISHISDKRNQVITLYSTFTDKLITEDRDTKFIVVYDIIDTNRCNSIFDEFANKKE